MSSFQGSKFTLRCYFGPLNTNTQIKFWSIWVCKIWIWALNHININIHWDMAQWLLVMQKKFDHNTPIIINRFYMTNTCLCPYYTIIPDMKVRLKKSDPYPYYIRIISVIYPISKLYPYYIQIFTLYWSYIHYSAYWCILSYLTFVTDLFTCCQWFYIFRSSCCIQKCGSLVLTCVFIVYRMHF